MAALDVIRRLTLQAEAKGFDQATQSVNKLGEAYDTSAKRQLSVEKSLQNLQRRYDQEFRAQQDLARVSKTLDLARAQGLITQQRHVELMRQAIQFHNTSAGAVTRHSAALQELSASAAASTASLGSAGAVLTRLGPVGLAVGAALAVVTLGLKQASDAALEMGNTAGKLRDASDTIGFTVEQLQAFTRAAGQTGVGQDQLNTALERFSVQLAEIRTQSGEAFKALDQINPAMARQVATAGSVTEAWDMIAEAMRDASREERNFLARSIFGRGGVGITRLASFTDMAGGIEAYTASLREADLITQQQAESWDDLRDSITTNVNAANQVITATFSGPILEALENLSEVYLNMARSFQETDWSGVVNAISAVASAVETLAGWIASAGRLWAQFRGMIQDIPESVTGSPAGLPGQLPRPEATGSPAGLPDAPALDARAAAMKRLGAATKDARKDALDFVDVMRNNVTALGDAATAGERYQLQVAELSKKLQEGTINQDTFNRAVFNLHPAVQQLQDVIGDLGSALAQAFINGKSGADALNASLKSISATAASSAINKLIKGDIGGAAISGAIAAGSFLFSSLFGGDNAEEQQAQAEAAERAAEALKQSREQLDGLVDSLKALNDAAGEVTGTISSGLNQLKELNRAALEQARIAMTEGGVSIPANIANEAFAEAIQAMQEGAVEFQKFANRTIEEARKALQGEQPLSEIAQAMADLQLQADDLIEAIVLLGNNAEDAARIVGEDLAMGLQRLRDSVEHDLLRRINEATGRGFINQFADLFQEIKDATTLGVNPDVVRKFMVAQSQALIESGQIMGDQFKELLALYPELTGQVQEYTGALEDQANELQRQQERMNSFARTIVDFVKGLFTREEVGGSPTDRLRAAQANYEETLKLARMGNEEALDRITAEAETFRAALRDVYGSSQEYQKGLQQIASDLLSLPAVQDSTDKIVNAIRDSIVVLEKIQLQLATAVPVQAAQHGGWITGGSYARDSTLLWASKGEFVVNNASARRYGGVLEAINDNTLMTSGGGGDLVAEIRALRQDIMRGFVVSSDNVREGVDEVAGAMNSMARDTQLRQQAPAA